MFKLAKGFWKSKTTWTVVTGVLGAVGAGLTGEVSWTVAGGGILSLLVGLFHNDTQRKIGEKEAEDRELLMSMATSGGPRFDLEGVLRAHSSTLKDSVANAVVAALTAALSGSKPGPNTGVDSRARSLYDEQDAVTGTGTDEDEDGEADAD